jgi:WD40 repeat protein
MKIELRHGLWLVLACLFCFLASFTMEAAEPARLGELRGVWHADFNSDASRLVVWTRNGQVGLWDVRKGTRINGDAALKKPFIAYLMSSDLRRFLLGFKDGHSQVFDASSGSAVSPVLDLSFREDVEYSQAVLSPDGGTIVFFGEKEGAVLDVKTGKRIAAIPIALESEGQWEPVRAAIFASGGAKCFVMGPEVTVTAYETKTWTPLGKPMKHPPAEMAADFGFEASPDGKWLVTFDDPGENGPQGQLQAWDAVTNKPLGDPLSAQNGMSGQFLPGQDRVLVQAGRGDATVRELPSMAIAYTIKMRDDDIDGPKVEVFPNGKWLLAWGKWAPDKKFDLIDSATGKTADTYSSSASVTSALSPADSSIFYLGFDNSAFQSDGYYDKYLHRFSAPNLKITGSIRILDSVDLQTLSPDDKWIMVIKGDTEHERIVVFEAATMKPVGWSKP